MKRIASLLLQKNIIKKRKVNDKLNEQVDYNLNPLNDDIFKCLEPYFIPELANIILEYSQLTLTNKELIILLATYYSILVYDRTYITNYTRKTYIKLQKLITNIKPCDLELIKVLDLLDSKFLDQKYDEIFGAILFKTNKICIHKVFKNIDNTYTRINCENIFLDTYQDIQIQTISNKIAPFFWYETWKVIDILVISSSPEEVVLYVVVEM